MRPGLAWAAGLAAVCLSACGSGAVIPIAGPPRPVNAGLVPASLGVDTQGVAMTVEEYVPARVQFARAGASSLVSQGRLWQVHRGSVLVGTLEIATVKEAVDVDSLAQRSTIVQGVLPGAFLTLGVDGFSVAASSVGDEVLYVWFAPNLFEVLQLKGANLVPESMLAQVIRYQRDRGLTPLPGGGRATSTA